MGALQPPLFTITAEELLADLEAGRSRPLVPSDAGWSLRPRPRPAVDSLRSRSLWLAARGLGRLHPRLARRALSGLWFTPWVHPTALASTRLPARFVPWSQPTAEGELHGYAGGHGPTAVLVHGWAGRAADWRHLADDLVADGWRVVVPDLPAHGTSPGRRTDLYALARAFAAVLAAERPAAVVAHSMGFPVTLLALEHGAPEPRRLVAIAPGRKVERVVAAFARRMAFRGRLADELGRLLEARFGSGVWDTLDVDRVVPGLRAAGLVVHDHDDDEVPLADGRAIAAAWPDARLAVTAGLGHRRILRDEGARAVVAAHLAGATLGVADDPVVLSA
ncbi:MAG TPA: alpha/beta fold hydrolase [Egicoccus sp.]|nr:alpha/beta fold hydrolase [Egicoccus sp.]HSK22492.1 alpha/beta fold hydrolase [Egicoccus sp.]